MVLGFRVQYFTESGHYIPERTHEVGLGAGLYTFRPRDDHRYTDSSFVEVAFISAPDTVAIEEVRIGSSFHVRSVIAGKDDDGVVIDTHIFQLLYNLAYIYVEAVNHGCKRCVRVELRAVSAFTECRVTRFGAMERFLGILAAELFDNAVFGHNQFGMRDDGRIPHAERFSAFSHPVKEVECL